MVDVNEVPDQYHEALDKCLAFYNQPNTSQLSQVVAAVPPSFDSTKSNSISITKSSKCPVLKQFIRERRHCHDRGQRGAALSKRISREARQAMRKWRTEWATLLLQRFSNLAPLSRINSAPKTSPSYPIDAADFANFLRDICSSHHPDYDVLPKHLLATIPSSRWMT